MMTTMTVRMDESEKSLIAEYAGMLGVSASQFMRRCAIERIDDEIDIDAYKKAKAAYDANPVSYGHGEIMKEFGLR